MSNAHFRCDTCGFELFIPLYQFKTSYLGLYDDRRFPGRCLLVYQKHLEHFELLSGADLSDFVLDIQFAVKAIKNALSVKRVNIAILGNAIPHLHAHLIPRDPQNDPVPNRAPWAHPEKSSKLSEEHRNEIIRKIVESIESMD